MVIDGTLAGIAAPYPHIYTGGWSNPYLWSAIPAPRTFDIKSIDYDLTPFVGGLTDGKAHDVRLTVDGLPGGQEGWSLAPNFLVWQDRASTQVTGALVKAADPGAEVRSSAPAQPIARGRSICTPATTSPRAAGSRPRRAA